MVKIGGGWILTEQERFAVNLHKGKPLLPAVKTEENFVHSLVAIARRLSASALTARSVCFLYGHKLWWWLRVEREGRRSIPPCSLLFQVCENKPACASVLFQNLCERLAGG